MGAAPTQRIPLNDLTRRATDLGPDLEAAVTAVARSGNYLYGAEVRAFELEFAEYTGLGECVGVASGTDALMLALAAAGCQPGDDVITAANAGGYASIAIRALGGVPRYADIDPATHTLSADSIEQAVTPTTRAIVVTHLYGRLASPEALAAARRTGVALIEDCAQAAGAVRDGAHAGSAADFAAFSFYPTKNLGALGDAGAVCTRDPEMAGRVRRLAQYGWASKYEVAMTGGRNSRLDEIQAAALRLGLPRLEAANERRRAIAARYADALGGERGRLMAGTTGWVAHLAVMLCDDRAATVAALDEAGIDTAVHYPTPDHHQPAWSGSNSASLGETEQAARSVLTLPCFPEMSEHEIARVEEALAVAP